MPSRILKESVCRSKTINQLTAEEEVFFYRLMVNCDDFGRFQADADILASLLFPMKRDLEASTVQSWLFRLAEVGLIVLYKNEGELYLQVVTWEKHQSIRNKKSKYPSLDDECSCKIEVGSDVFCEKPVQESKNTVENNREQLNTIEIICMQLKSNENKCEQLHANVPVIQSNPIQYESNPNPNPKDPPIPPKGAGVGSESDSTPDPFMEFWEAYPRKVGKEAARKAWKKIRPNQSLQRRILDAVEAAKQSKEWQKDNGQYIPHPATWLNQGRWDDELTPYEPEPPRWQPPNYDDEDDFIALLEREKAKEKTKDG